MQMSHMSRRRFIKTVAIGTTALASVSLLTGCTPAQFLHGVASGDPLQDRVVIWTRVTPERNKPGKKSGKEEVLWVVATDAECKRVVGAGMETTDASRDYTIKLDVTGLQPDTTYYYCFYSRNSRSPVGRMRTLPAGDVSEFNMAVVSCSNYPAGYFHVYGEIAARQDLHAVLHLGDYLYEYAADGYASDDAEAMGRRVSPATELLTLNDYRTRYAQYRTDPKLQAAHRQHSFICVWDDHEITNDTWREGAENHNEGEGDFETRRAQAIQAYYEWIPVREPEDGDRLSIYRQFTIGNLLDLYMLDTRVLGRDQQLDYAYYFTASGGFDAAAFQADLTDPNRTLLGLEQRGWLQGQMAQSTATWQVLGQQVLMGRMNLPAPIATQQVSFSQYQQLAYLAQTNPEQLTPEQWAVLQAPSIPYNLDAWDGYFVEREIVLETALSLDKNLVVLAGDTHNAWANNLRTVSGVNAGVELATSSVSSPGLEGYFPNEDPDALAAGVTQLIEPLQYANLQHRGYLVVRFSPEQCIGEYRYVSTVKSDVYDTLEAYSQDVKTLPGAGHRVIEVL
ncbi:MAG: alkaline phosphatase D family protein [Pseudomonadota bacterium]|nr:alkaline phosphatase D family protein [Pseudomonadota bacterium]